MRDCTRCGMPLANTEECRCPPLVECPTCKGERWDEEKPLCGICKGSGWVQQTTDWKLGQYVRIRRNEGYEYGHIETMDYGAVFRTPDIREVMLVGDDGKEIYCRVKDLEEG